MMKNFFKIMYIAAISLSPSFAQAELYNVGTRNDGAPYIEIDSLGIPGGFDMDIIQAIADDQGFEINVRVNDFADLLPGLDSGEFDLVIGGITITDERQLRYDFSKPYIEDHIGVLTTDLSLDLSSLESIAQLKMALERDSLFHRTFVKFGADPVLVDSVFLGIKKVAQGKADVFVSDEFIIAYTIDGYDGIDFKLQRLPSDNIFPDNKIGMAVKKGNTELLSKINQGLENIRSNGSYEQIKAKWNMD